MTSSVASLLRIPFAFAISVRRLFPLGAIVDIEAWEEAVEADRLERLDNTSLNLVDCRRGHGPLGSLWFDRVCCELLE